MSYLPDGPTKREAMHAVKHARVFQVTLFYGVNKIVHTEIMLGDKIKIVREKYLKKHPNVVNKMKENKRYWLGFKRLR